MLYKLELPARKADAAPFYSMCQAKRADIETGKSLSSLPMPQFNDSTGRYLDRHLTAIFSAAIAIQASSIRRLCLLCLFLMALGIEVIPYQETLICDAGSFEDCFTPDTEIF